MMTTPPLSIDKRSRNVMIVSGIWSLLLVLTCIFFNELYDALWVLLFVWMLACIVSGGLLFIWSLVALVKTDSKKVPLAISGFIFACLFVFMTSGVFWGQMLRFHLDKPRYEAVITRLQTAPHSTAKVESEPDFEVETMSPLLVAFQVRGGILDNWSAVVYDPSGKVAKANQFKGDWSNWDNPALAEVKELFGGDLTSADHITGPWYFCNFT